MEKYLGRTRLIVSCSYILGNKVPKVIQRLTQVHALATMCLRWQHCTNSSGSFITLVYQCLPAVFVSTGGGVLPSGVPYCCSVCL